MKKTLTIPTLCLLAVASLALPGFAQAADTAPEPEPATTPQACAPSAAGQLGDALLPVDQGRNGDPIGGVEEQATCTADCADGSSVTCWGTSCSAYDSNCNTSFRGYCTGTSSGTKYCPSNECQGPSCGAYASCPGTGPVSCSGTSSCHELDGCWVICDGNQTYCPAPAPNCPLF